MLLESMDIKYFKHIYLNSESVEDVCKAIHDYYQKQADKKFDEFITELQKIVIKP